MQKQFFKLLFPAGSILATAGVVLHLFELGFAPYVFATGAAIVIFVQSQVAIHASESGMRQQRLSRMGLLSALLLALAAYFMFTGSNLWVIAVLIYALTSFFLSFRGND